MHSYKTGDLEDCYHSCFICKKFNFHSEHDFPRQIYDTVYSNTQCHIAGLYSSEWMYFVIHMIDTKSIAEFYYINKFLEIFSTLEEAFAGLFDWSNEKAQTTVHLRKQKSQKQSILKLTITLWKTLKINFTSAQLHYKICWIWPKNIPQSLSKA